MDIPYRIVVAGPGGLGLCAIREVQRLDGLQLVGVLAYSKDKHGRDAGELAGIGPGVVKAPPGLMLPDLPQFHWKPRLNH